jgi:hypothetical protein
MPACFFGSGLMCCFHLICMISDSAWTAQEGEGISRSAAPRKETDKSAGESLTFTSGQDLNLKSGLNTVPAINSLSVFQPDRKKHNVAILKPLKLHEPALQQHQPRIQDLKPALQMLTEDWGITNTSSLRAPSTACHSTSLVPNKEWLGTPRQTLHEVSERARQGRMGWERKREREGGRERTRARESTLYVQHTQQDEAHGPWGVATCTIHAPYPESSPIKSDRR